MAAPPSVTQVINRYWPLFDLRLATPDLALRPMTEADLTELADLLPDDVEQDPLAAAFAIGDDRTRRGVVSHQTYWKALGTWRPDAWALNFVVSAAGRLVGVQELEGDEFPVLRTVDSSSFLIPSARGRGYGKQMRRAVLALAFGPMQAQAAITSAWHDNYASLGVSRALGYLPNGESLHAHPGRVDVLLHLRLKRADWLAAGTGSGIQVSGFEPCRPLFGLAADGTAADGAATGTAVGGAAGRD